MKDRLPYILFSVIFLILCILIVIVFRGNSFIRGFVGDAVIVMLLYCFVKSLIGIDALNLSMGVTAFAYTIEFSQYFKIVTLLGFQETYFTRLVFGSVFDPMDLLAYTIGAISIYFLDVLVVRKFLIPK